VEEQRKIVADFVSTLHIVKKHKLCLWW